jgi:hypothetical protein
MIRNFPALWRNAGRARVLLRQDTGDSKAARPVRRSLIRRRTFPDAIDRRRGLGNRRRLGHGAAPYAFSSCRGAPPPTGPGVRGWQLAASRLLVLAASSRPSAQGCPRPSASSTNPCQVPSGRGIVGADGQRTTAALFEAEQALNLLPTSGLHANMSGGKQTPFSSVPKYRMAA